MKYEEFTQKDKKYIKQILEELLFLIEHYPYEYILTNFLKLEKDDEIFLCEFIEKQIKDPADDYKDITGLYPELQYNINIVKNYLFLFRIDFLNKDSYKIAALQSLKYNK